VVVRDNLQNNNNIVNNQNDGNLPRDFNRNLPNPFQYLGISLGIQNVRSMNISTKNDLTTQKILAICNIKTDIIFLSDLRLNSNKQISAVHDLEKKFFFNGYKLHHNSRASIRGVGILIRKEMDEKLRIIEKIDSEDGNFLLLRVMYRELEFILCSVYGPNRDCEIIFYNELKTVLQNFNCPIVCGGDWNATYDNSPAEHNLDVVNMRNIPSNRRTEKILELCTVLNLIEPFRLLHPNHKEYTFIPTSANEINRSRLDYFLISKSIFGTGTSVKIPNSLSTTLFDHKHVQLFINKPRASRKNIVKDCILKNVDLPSYVKASVIECYLQHYEPDDNLENLPDREEVRNHLTVIGRIMTLLKDISNLEIKQAVEGHTERDDLLIEGKRGEINLLFDDLPELAFFENLPNNHNPGVFFQTLANCIRNNVLSHQATIYKLRKENKSRLNKRILELKKNFDNNNMEILRTERILSSVIEQELRDKSTDSIDAIKSDEGNDFATEEDRGAYIHDYFKNIYKQPNNRSKNVTIDDISNFLGPIQENEVVRNAILTNAERDEMESDISMEELTKSINDSNQSSSPGADGISNRFIKHFWEFFKVPMLKLTRFCIESNTMPQYFLSANIKLIPKKGDLSKIKNWRPISLLNCFYKIISRVITARLRKFMDKMTPTCQKGYSSTRYCQEVLIQVMEGIEKCKVNGVKGAIISLDIKKAFDSLSHSYLQSVYKFYNFGPKLTKWITLLSTKRKACIILQGDKTTEFFDLERGNAQGDTISPYLFNLGYQLLLFKLDLSFQIEGTQQEVASRVAPGAAEGGQEPLAIPVQAPEVGNPDPKVSAMADDCTLLVKLEYGNLQRIIQILQSFEIISGLGCNLEKTSLMPVGILEPISNDILSLGLEMSSEILLLGAKIKNTGICFEQNARLILEKVRKQINFWRRFGLSLPGRIGVSKTFLYSQINYLGCFMPMEQNILNEIAKEIEKYVRGNLKIGRQKIYDTLENGGLGLFDLNIFLSAQCCAWVRRSINEDELWKRELKYYSNGSVFCLRKKNFDKRKNPILYNIASCFEKFIFEHFSSEDGTLKTKEVFERETDLILTDAKYNVLIGLVRTAVHNFGRGGVICPSMYL